MRIFALEDEKSPIIYDVMVFFRPTAFRPGIGPKIPRFSCILACDPPFLTLRVVFQQYPVPLLCAA